MGSGHIFVHIHIYIDIHLPRLDSSSNIYTGHIISHAAMETEETRKAEGGVAEGKDEAAVKGQEDDVMDEEEEAEEEEEEEAAGGGNLEKWLEPKGAEGEEGEKGPDAEGQEGEEDAEGGGSNDLWDAARQMKEDELARERERAEEVGAILQ